MKIREGAVGSSTHRAVLAGELLDLLLGIFEGRHVVDLFDLGCHVVGSCAWESARCGGEADRSRGNTIAGVSARRAAVDATHMLMCLPLLLG